MEAVREPAETSLSRREMLLSLMLPIYLPAGMTTTASTLLVPFLPVWLRDLGASDATVGAFFSLQGLGATVSGPPSGMVPDLAYPIRTQESEEALVAIQAAC